MANVVIRSIFGMSKQTKDRGTITICMRHYSDCRNTCVHSHWTVTLVYDRHSDKQTHAQHTVLVHSGLPHNMWGTLPAVCMREVYTPCELLGSMAQFARRNYHPSIHTVSLQSEYNKMFFLFLIPLLLCVGGGIEWERWGKGLCRK